MTRLHRRWHLWLWLILGPLILTGLILSVVFRPEALP
jgi:hypothetical protein